MKDVSLNRERLPLSMPGSLMGISAETRTDKNRFFVRSLHRFADPRDLLGIGLPDQPNPTSVELYPETVKLGWTGASLEAVFSGRDSLRLRVVGSPGELMVAPEGAEVSLDQNGTILVTHPAGSPKLRVSAVYGALRLSHNRIIFGEGSPGGEVVIQELDGDPDPGGDFDSHARMRAGEFQNWLKRFEALYPKANSGALTEAAYLFWCCQAGPQGSLRRPAVLMSKNWMTGIWSWDNCFNAIALADIDPALAWDQFCFFFDWQAEDGRLPDVITASGVDWGMTKPPLYGWALSKMGMRNEFFKDPSRLKEVYDPMVRQVRFWLETRDSDGDGLPEYHHGCDSGWDNGTMFEGTLPTASPDLAAWLILQLEELARIAPLVNRAEESPVWLDHARNLAESMKRHCWDGEIWQGVQAATHRPSAEGDCLLPWLCGMAGHHFSTQQQHSVLAALQSHGRFLTSHGIATEAITSELFEIDGYWRGPIWGPSTVMAVEACRACGDAALAKRIAESFCSMAPRYGFAENHNPLTGEGLRDPGYTWTAAAWLILQRI